MTAPTPDIWRTALQSIPENESLAAEIAAQERKAAKERETLAAKREAADVIQREWVALLQAGAQAAQSVKNCRDHIEIVELHRQDAERRIHALAAEFAYGREWFSEAHHTDVLANHAGVFASTNGELPFIFWGRKIAATDAALVVIKAKLPALEAAEVAARREAEAFARKHGIQHDFGLK